MRARTIAIATLLATGAFIAGVLPTGSAVNYCTALTDPTCDDTVCYGMYRDEYGREHCRVEVGKPEPCWDCCYCPPPPDDHPY